MRRTITTEIERESEMSLLHPWVGLLPVCVGVGEVGQKGFRNLRPVERGSMISDISYRCGLVSFAFMSFYIILLSRYFYRKRSQIPHWTKKVSNAAHFRWKRSQMPQSAKYYFYDPVRSHARELFTTCIRILLSLGRPRARFN